MVPQPGHRQQGLRLVAEGDQGDGVVVAELVGEDVQGLLHQVEAARLGHRAGDVDDEGERGGRAFVTGGGGPGGQPHPYQRPVLALVPGAGPVDVDAEAVAVRALVALAEAVDELLGPHGRRLRQGAVGEGAAGVAVRGGVDVQGEGRQVVGGADSRSPSCFFAPSLSAAPAEAAGRGPGREPPGLSEVALVPLGVPEHPVSSTPPASSTPSAARVPRHVRTCRPVCLSVRRSIACPQLRLASACECDVRGGAGEQTKTLRICLDAATKAGDPTERQGQDTMSLRMNPRKASANRIRA